MKIAFFKFFFTKHDLQLCNYATKSNTNLTLKFSNYNLQWYNTLPQSHNMFSSATLNIIKNKFNYFPEK